MLELYANALVSGLMIGAIYALMATGLNIIFGVMRVVNFAHGEMVVVGMYVAYVMSAVLGWPVWAGVPIAAVTTFAAGYIFQRFFANDFVDRPQHVQFVLYIGVGLMITGLQAIIFGPDPRAIQDASSFATYRMGFLRLDAARVQAAVAALVVVVGLWAWLRYSLTGKALRAAADNLVGGKIIGIKTTHVFALTAAIGIACAGIAGALIAPLYDTNPYLSSEYTLTAFIVVIVGGLASLPGALVGGILIGVSEALAAVMISPSAKSFVSYVLLLLVILVRPNGLFGAARTS